MTTRYITGVIASTETDTAEGSNFSWVRAADLIHDDRIEAALAGAQGQQVAAGRDERGDHHLRAPQHRAAHLPGRLLHLRRALPRLCAEEFCKAISQYEIYINYSISFLDCTRRTQWARIPVDGECDLHTAHV